MIRLSPLLGLCCCLALLTPVGARAQIQAPTRLQEVDPDAPEATSSDDADTYEPEAQDPDEDEDAAEARPRRGAPAKGKGKGKAVEPAEAAPPQAVAPAPPVPVPAAPVPATRPPPPPVLAPKVADADLVKVWDRWRQARSRNDTTAAEAALKDLLTLKDEVLASDLEPLSVGFVREAGVRQRAGDLPGALRLLDLSVSLSPGLPYARFARAEVYALADPGNVGRTFAEAREAVVALAKDARYRRPSLADLGVTALAAWVATALAVVGVLFVRRVRYALHDFHHALPRAVARWQSALLGVLLLGVPLALGLGVVPVLLVFLGVVALYLSLAERVVATVLLAGLGLVPLAAGALARATAFAGTVAEDVYLLERGGLSAHGAIERVRAREAAKSATFAELAALAHFESRRGQLEEARAHFKAASALRSGDARLLTRFGNALVGLGDADGAVQLYTQASQADAMLAAPHYNLAQVYRRRARAVPDAQVGAELDRAATAIAAAQALDGSLLRREPPPEDRPLLNQLVLAPPMPESEWLSLADGAEEGQRVEAEAGRWLLRGVEQGPVAWALPAVVAAVLVAWGAAAGRLKVAKVCEKCGRPVCVRCDKELGVGSKLCGQCVNVFARKGLVPKELRARKQDEVDRHQAWSSRATYALGGLMSGAGHVFAGMPVKGALYAFAFLFAVTGLVFHRGLVRAPYGDAPLYLKLAPAVLVLLTIYLLSLRGLRRHQRGEG